MENTSKSTFNFEEIAWGSFFILWGITELLPSLPKGTGAVGIGIILVGLNLARSWNGQPTSGFTTTLTRDQDFVRFAGQEAKKPAGEEEQAPLRWRTTTSTPRASSRSSPTSPPCSTPPT